MFVFFMMIALLSSGCWTTQQSLPGSDSGADADADADPPWCTFECADIQEGDNCCIDCDYMPAVKIVPAGTDVLIPWDGTLSEADFELCSDCECYLRLAAPYATYSASVGIHPDVECWGGDCEPDADGVIWDGSVTGDPTTYTKDFAVPPVAVGHEDIVIEIE